MPDRGLHALLWGQGLEAAHAGFFVIRMNCDLFPVCCMQATVDDMPRFADEDLQLILDDVATYKQA